jgi:hypothetical protein
MPQLNDLGKVLTNQIYHTVIGGDDKVPPPKNTFLTWCQPGMAFTANDFDFCGTGVYSAATAEDMRNRLQHAFNLSVLFDFIPDTGAPYSNSRQEGMFKPDAEKRLSEMYREILRFSKVVKYQPTAEETAKLAKFRGLLTTTKKVKDLITDEEKEVTDDGPVVKAYNDKQANYLAAVTEYNAKRIAAAAASGSDGKAAVADWSMNAQTYYLKVKSAADAWTSAGYRNEVDEMNAYINQVTQRKMVLWKQQLMENYDKAQITGTDIPIAFPYTTVVPGNFATSGGWTSMGVSQDHVAWSNSNSTSSWNAGAGVSFGLFSIGGSAGGTKTEVSADVQVNSFNLSFDLTQVLVVRPGFYPEWFANRGWTLRKGEGWTFSDLPSDGGNPPKGEFIGYATQAIMARNVAIRSSEFVSAYNKVQSSVGGGGSVGWGPFKLSGGYSHSSGNESFQSDAKGEWLRVPGIQCIAFVNHLIGKSPNPLPDLRDSDFE